MVSGLSPGAKIYIDGQLVARAPAQLRRMKPGSYLVRAERSGYGSFRLRVVITAGLVTDALMHVLPITSIPIGTYL